ncbi:MAG TPA: serine/threonine-protein kinase [Planctomycetaceae bacterium]|nr:serine/threonine-protein kinase [Planctomycetaceae bacterium]
MASLFEELAQEGVDVGEPTAIAAALVRNGTLTEWQAKELLRGRHRGFILGKYRLLSLLERGGTSAVYLAEHRLMRRRCAIKVFPKTHLGDSIQLGRFRRQTQLVAALNHPNLIRAYDVDSALDGKAEVHLFVMEFVDGESLHDRVLRKGPLPPVEAANWIRQAADGLAYAHRCGVVHGNVKPTNLLVSREGVIKILDLGLAKLFDPEAPAPAVLPAPLKNQRLSGTAGLLAAEQSVEGGPVAGGPAAGGPAAGGPVEGGPVEASRVDPRSDIDNLGCTFYFLLVGQPLIPGRSLRQPLLGRLAQIRPDVPADLALILSRMMANQPADRYQTSEQVSEVLREWLVRHADPEWLAQNPAVLSSPDVLKKRSPDAKTPSAESASASAAVGTGLASADSRERTSTSKVSANGSPNVSANVPLRVARPLQDFSAGTRRPTPTGRVSAPATSSQSGPTVGIDTKKALPIDQYDHHDHQYAPQYESSVVDSLFGRPRVRRRRGLEIVALVLVSAVTLFGGLGWFTFRQNNLPLHSTQQRSTEQTFSEETSGEQTSGEQTSGEQTPSEQTPSEAAVLPEPAAAPAPTRRPIEGDIRVGPKDRYQTLADAIDFVRQSYAHGVLFSGSGEGSRTIRVAGGHTYPERIEIDNSDFHFPKGLRIVCNDPVPAILAPPGPQPVVRLHGVERFTFEGFEIDAAGKRAAIELSGYLVGTRLCNLRICGDCETSLLIRGAMGLQRPQSRCILDHLVLRRQRSGGSGVRFDQGIDSSSNLTIRGCRFFGPFESAIAFSGPVVGIDIRESIITGAAVGMLLEREGLAVKDLAIVNNTFHQLNQGIVVCDTPPSSSLDWIVQRNLFAAVTEAEMFVERGGNRAQFLGRFGKGAISGNWTSRKVGKPLPEGEIDLFTGGGQTGAALRFQANDPDKDRFLWPVAQAPYRTAGAVILK